MLAAVVIPVLCRVAAAPIRRGEAALARVPVPAASTTSPPPILRDFARRGEAMPGDLATRIRLTQLAEYRRAPDAPWVLLRARQAIATAVPEFLWVAHQGLGPVSAMRVVESLQGGRGALRLHRFGLLPAGTATGPEIDRAEAMRYLAELPWAPDAILGNAALSWQALGDGRVEVSLPVAGGAVSVRFRFDARGDIVEMLAENRPVPVPGGVAGQADWRVLYRDYRMIGPRRIPAEGEAGHVLAGRYRPYFQMRVTGCDAEH